VGGGALLRLVVVVVVVRARLSTTTTTLATDRAGWVLENERVGGGEVKRDFHGREGGWVFGFPSPLSASAAGVSSRGQAGPARFGSGSFDGRDHFVMAAVLKRRPGGHGPGRPSPLISPGRDSPIRGTPQHRHLWGISLGARDSLELPLRLFDDIFVGGDMIPIFNVMLHRGLFKPCRFLRLVFESQPPRERVMDPRQFSSRSCQCKRLAEGCLKALGIRHVPIHG
jgi:hypothetical protein